MLPILNSFGMRENYGDRPYPALADGDVGMVEDTRTYDKGRRPALYAPNGHYTGTPEQWLDGSIVGVHPALDVTRLGYSRECLRALGYIVSELDIRQAESVGAALSLRLPVTVRQAQSLRYLASQQGFVRQAERIIGVPSVQVRIAQAQNCSGSAALLLHGELHQAERIIGVPSAQGRIAQAQDCTGSVMLALLGSVRQAERIIGVPSAQGRIAEAQRIIGVPSAQGRIAEAQRINGLVALATKAVIAQAQDVPGLAGAMGTIAQAQDVPGLAGAMGTIAQAQDVSGLAGAMENIAQAQDVFGTFHPLAVPGAECDESGPLLPDAPVVATREDADQWWASTPVAGSYHLYLDRISGDDKVTASVYTGSCDAATFYGVVDYTSETLAFVADGTTQILVVVNGLPSGSSFYRLELRTDP